MENASKALIMAGSILAAVLIIGLISVTYTRISNLQQTKNDAEKSSKMINYAKSFEGYNRTIYGSELLSLANLLVDYNDRQVDMKGYKFIKINVKITKGIKENGNIYLNAQEQSITSVRSAISTLERDIEYFEQDDNGYKNKLESNKRSVKYYAQLSNRQIATLFEIDFSSGETDYDIGDRLSNELENRSTSKLLKDIEKYKNLKTTYTEFKNTYFTCEAVKYDSNGIISEMSFKQRN